MAYLKSRTLIFEGLEAIDSWVNDQLFFYLSQSCYLSTLEYAQFLLCWKIGFIEPKNYDFLLSLLLLHSIIDSPSEFVFLSIFNCKGTKPTVDITSYDYLYDSRSRMDPDVAPEQKIDIWKHER